MDILLTGATGFLGSVIRRQISEVSFLDRKHNTSYDLALRVPELERCYDAVVHAAGKAHFIPKNAADEALIYRTNVTGTQNLLTALENAAPKAFMLISSVAAYGRESGIAISEEESLNATDSYGKSKIEAEKLVHAWCNKHRVRCSILRLPLIAGKDPPGNLGDMISAIQKGYYFNIGGGKARRSIVMAEDVAKIIPIALEKGGTYNLTDGYHPSFKELSVLIARQLHRKRPPNLPIEAARLMAKLGDLAGKWAPFNTAKLRKMTCDLTFDDSLARKQLGWTSSRVLDEFTL